MAKKRELGFFDIEFRQKELTEQGDPLEKLDTLIDWEIFKPTISKVFEKESIDKSKGGAPAYDQIMMFKILVLQNIYSLADERTEFAIKDRLSFMRFLGLKVSDKVPDQNTIWLFREKLAKAGAIEKMFKTFKNFLIKKEIIMNKGSIVDASFIEARRQRNSKEENKQIKEGKIPEDWQENQAKLCQKDVAARWTIKNKETHYGYKDHVKADKDSKIITDYVVTSANIHDSQALPELISKKDAGSKLYADSAYRSQEIDGKLKTLKIKNMIHEKGYRNNPLTKKQKEANRRKSKTRARVEHVFGFLANTIKSRYIRCVGLIRAEGVIGLANLVYNLTRYQQLVKLRT